MEMPAFQALIWQYYADNARQFPWRDTVDPYAIFLSEVMLQQTQAGRVVAKYEEFMKALPTFEALANASVAEVLRLWQGLGYNRRALNLQKAAQQIQTQWKGVLARDVEAVDSLPGIGPATAASIVAFAYNLPTIFIETNIRRVFIHCFFPEREEVQDGELLPLITEAVDRENPREWYYALMDYGSMLVKMYPNPNRRSKHYTKQSAFEGSNRQLRGAILRFLQNREATFEEIVQAGERGPSEVEVCLMTLGKEGFLEKNAARYRLKV